MSEQLRKINARLEPLASLVEDIKSIKLELANLQSSVSMAHDTINTFSESVSSLKAKVAVVEETICAIPALQVEIDKLTANDRENDQRARANNVEIKGIPIKN